MVLLAATLNAQPGSELLAKLRREVELQPESAKAHECSARHCCRKAIRRKPFRTWSARNGRICWGLPLAQEHRAPEAIEKLVAALEAKPDDPDVLYYLGKQAPNCCSVLSTGWFARSRIRRGLTS